MLHCYLFYSRECHMLWWAVKDLEMLYHVLLASVGNWICNSAAVLACFVPITRALKIKIGNVWIKVPRDEFQMYLSSNRSLVSIFRFSYRLFSQQNAIFEQIIHLNDNIQHELYHIQFRLHENIRQAHIPSHDLD